MEADAALVGPDGIVVLHTPSALHANIIIVILPADAEADHPVGLRHPAQNLVFVVFFFVLYVIEDVFRHFLNRLDEFRLAGVAFLHPLNELIEVDML